jgi:serine/threonine protein kinase
MYTFENEVAILRKITHDSMAKLADVQRMGKGYNYIIMELIEGKTLAKHLSELA